MTSNMSRMTQFSDMSDILTSTFFDTDHNTASPTPVTATNAAFIVAFSRLMSQHNDLANRFSYLMSEFQKTSKEAETLRQENTNLHVANCELNHQISLLLEAAAASFSENYCGESGSPTSVIEKENGQKKVEDGRVSLPKSISVRSNDYLKISSSGSSASSSESKTEGKRAGSGGSSKTRDLSPVSGMKKVYVRGRSTKSSPIELDLFNQGMLKTELCNKWQETGDCPYGDHCQFAHGITELRPVIRHPRYKTEVCRMVLTGDPCPYGHRCHFRHALTEEEQEQLMLPLRLE